MHNSSVGYSGSRYDRGYNNDHLNRSDNDVDLDSAQLYDEKVNKLETMNRFLSDLERENVNVSNIKIPDINSSIKHIDNTLELLRSKYYTKRYATYAEEVACGLGGFLEYVFDGKNTVPVLNIKPNYKGYTSTIRNKMRGMRTETSEMVGGLFNSNSSGLKTKMAMELLPSFIVYPFTRSKSIKDTELDETFVDSHASYDAMRSST